MEFVGRDGRVFRLNDKRAPNHFAFEHRVVPSPGVCTKAFVKLHPMTDDEEGVLVPFEGFDEAVRFARELGQRRIGLAVAVLGAHYIANFLSPDEGLAGRLKAALPEALGINTWSSRSPTDTAGTPSARWPRRSSIPPCCGS